jgi:hypothetical protein
MLSKLNLDISNIIKITYGLDLIHY